MKAKLNGIEVEGSAKEIAEFVGFKGTPSTKNSKPKSTVKTKSVGELKKSLARHYRRWTEAENNELYRMVTKGYSAKYIAQKLRRSLPSVYTQKGKLKDQVI